MPRSPTLLCLRPCGEKQCQPWQVQGTGCICSWQWTADPSLPRKDPFLILRKQELKIWTGIWRAGQLGKLSLTLLPATPTHRMHMTLQFACTLLVHPNYQPRSSAPFRDEESEAWGVKCMITGQDGEHSTGLRQSTPGLSIFPLGLSISLYHLYLYYSDHHGDARGSSWHITGANGTFKVSLK